MARERRYELDWLRTLVVLGLIPVHTASLFTPTRDLFLKNPDTTNAMVMVGAFAGVFGMPLLFFVSGAASWYSLRTRSNGHYVRARVLRLLVPLLFATLAIIPIQVYLVTLRNPSLASVIGAPIYDPHYLDSFLRFYPQYLLSYLYFLGHPSMTGFIAFIGHLWFVLYLLVFSLIALPLFIALRRPRGVRLLDWLAKFGSYPGAIFAFAAPLALVDAVAHAIWMGVGAVAEILIYLMCFIYGYALYADPRIRQAIRRQWPVALVAGFGLWLIAEVLLVQRPLPPYTNTMGSVLGVPLRGIIAWLWLVGLLGFGLTCLNRSSRLLGYLGDATLPIYVLHVSAIFVVASVVLPWQAPLLIKFVAIMVGAFIVLLTVYEALIKPLPPMRVLFGLRKTPPLAEPSTKPPPVPDSKASVDTAR